MGIKIVTDSTSDIPSDVAARLGITVVPLTVSFGQETFRDRVNITTGEFYRRLAAESNLPTTSPPPAEAFTAAFSKLLSGGDDVLAIVISSKLSKTYENAVKAVLPPDKLRITVIDSLTAGMGLGLLAISAAKMASEKGATLNSVTGSIRLKLAKSRMVVTFDTLRYMVKGGRIGRAAGLVGSVMSVKPVLTVSNGEIAPAAKLRSMSAGSDYLYDFVAEHTKIAELAVEHATTPMLSDALVKRLSAIYPPERIYRSTFSPVLGTYMGPNVLSVSLLEA